MIRASKLIKRVCYSLLLLTLFQVPFYYTVKKEGKSEEQVESNDEKICWEDEEFNAYENNRTGPGEQCAPFTLSDPKDIARNEEFFRKEGFYVVVSDKISVNRSVADNRPDACKTKKYLRKLPSVSIIITFHNEVWSVLLRCIHSIFNRTPRELLHEVMLLNDASTFPELGKPLQKYVDENFDGKVVIHSNEKREGLIRSRMIGAKMAKAEVIMYLDSHMEVGVNYLPPLLDALVHHPTHAVASIVGGIDHATFACADKGVGFRGAFDWSFRGQWLPRWKTSDYSENYELPSLAGNAYVIMREHFFNLGGYDEGLHIWNGENYEISLKLWLCSGGILSVPCSRASHLSKLHTAYRTSSDGSDFVARNLKRVAEVWLDDYKKYFYRTDQERYDKADPGDLSKQFELKRRLKCKPFQYFLDVVMPEFLLRYPLEPQYFATGSVQNLELKQCISLTNYDYYSPLTLTDCSQDLKEPKRGTDFTLTMEKSFRYNDSNDQCLEGQRQLSLINCYHQGGPQLWVFNITTRQIFYPRMNKCLTALKPNDNLALADCDENSNFQKWLWARENITALANWNSTGIDNENV